MALPLFVSRAFGVRQAAVQGRWRSVLWAGEEHYNSSVEQEQYDVHLLVPRGSDVLQTLYCTYDWIHRVRERALQQPPAPFSGDSTEF